MDIQITAIHFPGTAKTHEAIASFKWVNIPADGKTTVSDKAVLVDWIDNKGGKAWVADGTEWVSVVTVAGIPKYLRSKKDGVLSDNLLSLPTF
jgi:hypothetical protein